MSVDLVKPLKYESDEGDFGPVQFNPNEDVVNANGYALNDNENIIIDSDGSGNIQFKDVVAGGPHTLADLLVSSGGITESQHKVLDQLVHLIAESNHQDITYNGWKVTDIIHWIDDNKTTKIREINLTYNGWKTNTLIIKQYNAVGTLVETLTGTFSWTGWKINYIDWVLS